MENIAQKQDLLTFFQGNDIINCYFQGKEVNTMGKSNRTKRQKKTLRRYAIGLSTCVIAATILVTASLVNRQEHVPVVFSDILDGATVVSGTEDENFSEIISDEEYLYERLFETETIILTTTPSFFDRTTTRSSEETTGAGGVLLIDTTSTTSPPPKAEKSTESSTEVSESTASSSEFSGMTTTPFATEEITYKTQIPVITPESSATTVSTNTTTTVRTTTTSKTTKKTTAKKTEKTTAKTSGTSKTPFTNIGGGTVSDDDEVYITMLNLVNEAREEAGLNKLWYSARVHEVATQRAYELSSYYSHTREDGRGFHTAFVDKGIRYKTVGENIAYGRNMFKTPEEVFESWMNSESHRENSLHPDFECVGFGLSTLKIGKDTYYYWSQEFAVF